MQTGGFKTKKHEHLHRPWKQDIISVSADVNVVAVWRVVGRNMSHLRSVWGCCCRYSACWWWEEACSRILVQTPPSAAGWGSPPPEPQSAERWPLHRKHTQQELHNLLDTLVLILSRRNAHRGRVRSQHKTLSLSFTRLSQQLWFMLQLHHVFINSVWEDHQNLTDEVAHMLDWHHETYSKDTSNKVIQY